MNPAPSALRARPVRAQQRRRGAALLMVLLLAVALGAIVVILSGNAMGSMLVRAASERSVVLYNAAEAGLAEGRSAVNGDVSLFPDSGYTILENAADVYDAAGNQIPHIHRSLYVGPVGNTSGRWGNFGTVISVVEDDDGNKAVHRGDIVEDNFAKYAYFTNDEAGLGFRGGDQLYGPTHSNDFVSIDPSGSVFKDNLSTSQAIVGKAYGEFDHGYKEHTPVVPLPGASALAALKTLAQTSGTFFAGSTNGAYGEATTRVEFVAVDLNGDGNTTDEDEGFFRVFSTDAANATRLVAGGDPTNTPNCGDIAGGSFLAAKDHNAGAPAAHQHPGGGDPKVRSLMQPNASCYLGGDERLNANQQFIAAGVGGAWRAYPGVPDPRLVAVRADAAYLFPISRALNPAFRGVVYVDGNVAVSGTVRGPLTIATPNNVVFADDVVQSIQPGGGGCDDILGLFAGQDAVIADNTINSPQVINGGADTVQLDDTKDLFLQAITLSLGTFTAQNFDQGPHRAVPCEVYTSGRGCLYLNGGVIQGKRGSIGTLSADQTNGETGYLKRYAYNSCGGTNPPPYFPMTARFRSTQTFVLDPVSFDINAIYRTTSKANVQFYQPPPGVAPAPTHGAGPQLSVVVLAPKHKAKKAPPAPMPKVN